MIYIVSLYYPPVSNPPANRMGHLTRILSEKYGVNNIRVVTGRPNYPHGKLPKKFKWKIFCRESGAYSERIDHIYEYPAPFKGLYRKTFGQLSFALSVFLYFLFRKIRKNDIILVTSGPVFPIYSFLILSYLKRNLRYVVDVRDLWPQVVAGMGFMQESSKAYRLLLKLAEATYRRAVALVGNSQGICNYLSRVAPNRPVSLVFNPVDTKFFAPMNSEEKLLFRSQHASVFPDDGLPVFLFSGTFSSYIGISTLLDALVQLKDSGEKFRFIMIGQGEGEAGIHKCIQQNDMQDHIKMLPFMERSKLVQFVGAADFCFASLRDSPMLHYAIPTKVIEYLACNKPVVAVVSGPFADMLREADVAYLCSAGNVEALVNLLKSLIKHFPESANKQEPRAFIQKNFSLEKFEEGFRSFFKRIFPIPE